MSRFLPPSPVALLSLTHQCAVITQLLCGCSVLQSCPTVFATPMDCSLPVSSVLGISQARILEWAAISSSRGSLRPRNWTHVSCIAGRFFTAEPCPCSVILFFPCSGCLLGQIRIRKVKDFIFSIFIPSLMLLFSLCRSRFLTCIIFHLLEDFFFHFFAGQGCLWWVCQFFFFNDKAFISPSFWIIISMNIEFWGGDGVSYFKYFTLLLLAWWEVHCNSLSSVDKMFFPPCSCFQDFVFVFWLSEYDMGTLSFLGSVVNFGKFLAIIISNVFSASFFSSDIPVMCMCYTFWNCPTVFGYCLFRSFFSLHLSLQSVCWPVFQLTAAFSGCVESLMRPRKAFS